MAVVNLACVADVSFSFSGREIEQVRDQAGERRSADIVNFSRVDPT